MKRPKLLFVGAFPPPGRKIFGGIVTSCRLLLEASLPEKCELVLLDTTQISHPVPHFFVRLVLAMRRFVRFLVLFERSKPVCILVFVSDGASIVEKGVMSWYAAARGVPSLLFPRGGAVIDQCTRSGAMRAFVRVFFMKATIVLCQSEAWQRFAVHQMKLPPERTQILYNWTATPELLEIGRKVRREQTDVKVHLLYVGWVEEAKGIFDLLKMCEKLAETQDFKLSVVGGGAGLAKSQQLCQDSALAHKVTFHGWLEFSELKKLYEAADIFVLPSWAEGMPNSMIEAMAAGLAIVVTRVGCVADFISHNNNGKLVEARNTDELLSAVEELITEPKLRSRLAARAFETANKEFSVEHAVETLTKVVQRAADGKPMNNGQ